MDIVRHFPFLKTQWQLLLAQIGIVLLHFFMVSMAIVMVPLFDNQVAIWFVGAIAAFAVVVWLLLTMPRDDMHPLALAMRGAFTGIGLFVFTAPATQTHVVEWSLGQWIGWLLMALCYMYFMPGIGRNSIEQYARTYNVSSQTVTICAVMHLLTIFQGSLYLIV